MSNELIVDDFFKLYSKYAYMYTYDSLNKLPSSSVKYFMILTAIIPLGINYHIIKICVTILKYSEQCICTCPLGHHFHFSTVMSLLSKQL